MAAVFRKLFRRKKPAPLVCAVDLDHDPNHQHTAACFVDFEPLAVVELFQSQGCVSCPPAVPGIVAAATSQPNLALLSYGVTLFDHPGWRDTFASPQWDARQRAYARRWGRSSLFTPMVVVDGLADGPGVADGGHDNDVPGIVARARALRPAVFPGGWHIYLDVNDTDVRIDSDKQAEVVADTAVTETQAAEGGQQPAAAAATVYDILVAAYDLPSGDKVKIAKGPNKGKKVEHRNVVRSLTKIGEWSAGNVVVPLPPAARQPGQGAVVLVQEPAGGPIVAAARV